MTVAATDDRLRLLCENAVRGIHPPPDWHVEFLPGPARIEAAVVAFTGVHVVAADVDETDARAAFAAETWRRHSAPRSSPIAAECLFT